VKKNLDEERQNASSISPSIALFAALAALILGPFVAYQFTSNQLAPRIARSLRPSRVATAFTLFEGCSINFAILV